MNRATKRWTTSSLINQQLLDGLSYVDTMVSGAQDGFLLDGICDVLGRISENGSDFTQFSMLRSIRQEPLEYDGIAGSNWHQIAHEWLLRFIRHIADLTERNVISGPTEEGSFLFQLLPPIYRREELSHIRIAYRSPERLRAKVEHEFTLLKRPPTDLGDRNREDQRSRSATVLTENDRSILLAMLELDTTPNKPETRETICQAALARSGQSKDFDRIKKAGYMDGKAGLGCWLTNEGRRFAETLSDGHTPNT